MKYNKHIRKKKYIVIKYFRLLDYDFISFQLPCTNVLTFVFCNIEQYIYIYIGYMHK